MLPRVGLEECVWVGVTADEKVDEMEAETPEHLSELEQGDGQHGADDKADDNTSKLSSPQPAAAGASPDHPGSSGGKDRHRQERRSSSRHSGKRTTEDDVASGNFCSRQPGPRCRSMWCQV